ncbi:hypothetical protein SAR116_0170 [Candidatus Puniceispirillum marinum IMCC1322]|uniref:DUF177 domain-containing protein n=2 Tax=Candidatus Puniceispirillum TaxID=767891 RepID=D5BPD1_PUNMI|nr:hypothetical protein SAR116_0170 [Candidatus Puniceispirillum marinum IMCC1322]
MVFEMPVFSLSAELAAETIKPDATYRCKIIPSEDEIDMLLARFDYIAVNDLVAELQIRKVARDCWDIQGRLTADVVQSCVVTGEPLAESVDFTLEERYVRLIDDTTSVEVDLDGVEPLKNGFIDLGEMVMQSLALAVTAWPRATGAAEYTEPEPVKSDHPFAGLAAMKQPTNKN